MSAPLGGQFVERFRRPKELEELEERQKKHLEDVQTAGSR